MRLSIKGKDMLKNVKKYFTLFLMLFLVSVVAEAKVFENAEDGKIERWSVIKGGSSSHINNLYDSLKKSRVIEFRGLGIKSGYEIKINSNDTLYSLDVKAREKFYIEFTVNTDNGIKYLAYTPENSNYLGKDNFIRHGLGSKLLNNQWQSVSIDLQKDLNEAQKGVKIKNVIKFRVYGNLSIDNLKSVNGEDTPAKAPQTPKNFKAVSFVDSVKLTWSAKNGVKYKLFRDGKLIKVFENQENSFIDTGLKPNTLYKYSLLAFNDLGESKKASLSVKTKKREIPDQDSKSTLYEDAEDGKTDGWVVYDSYPFGAKVENVYDEERGSRVIKLSGAGIANGYWLKSIDGKRWANDSQFIFKMDMKFDDDFVLYIEVLTNEGRKYLTYTTTVDNDFVYGKYVVIALDDSFKDGKWHTFKRNLQSDLNSLSKAKIKKVEGLMIRGNGELDDISLMDKDNFIVSKPSDPLNVTAEVNGVNVLLKWEDSSAGKADYKIYRDGKLIEIYTKKGEYSYVDEDLEPNREYKYKIVSFIGSNESEGVEINVATKEIQGRIFYVSPNGNDEWSGKYPTPKDGDGPWRTIQHAVDMAKAGDTVMVRGGRYPGRVVFKHSGNEKEGYITFRNYPGEKPVIVRDDTVMADTVVGYGVSYIKFIGFHVYKPNRGGIIFYGPGSHIVIKNNEVSESNANIPETKRLGHAINVTARKDKPMSYITIEGNHVHHNHTGNPNRAGAYNEALTVLGNVKYFKIINNEVHDNDFIGVDVIGHQRGQFSVFGMNKYGLVAGNKIYRNGVRKIWASALYVDGAENLIVENNLVYDNFGLGITISQETPESTTENVIVRNNVGWNNNRGGMIGSANRGTVKNSVFVHNVLGNSSTEADLFLGNAIGWRIKNNIFSSEGSAPFMFKDISHKTGSWIMDYNIYKDISFIQVGGNYRSFGEYQSKSGKDQHSFSVSDIGFKDKEGHNFALRADSEAVDSGGFLTSTVSGGKGSVIKVYDAAYFTDGYGLREGDLIKVGDNDPVRVTRVDYASNEITVDKEIEWNEGDGVSYAYEGAAPDIGAYEYRG